MAETTDYEEFVLDKETPLPKPIEKASSLWLHLSHQFSWGPVMRWGTEAYLENLKKMWTIEGTPIAGYQWLFSIDCRLLENVQFLEEGTLVDLIIDSNFSDSKENGDYPLLQEYLKELTEGNRGESKILIIFEGFGGLPFPPKSYALLEKILSQLSEKKPIDLIVAAENQNSLPSFNKIEVLGLSNQEIKNFIEQHFTLPLMLARNQKSIEVNAKDCNALIQFIMENPPILDICRSPFILNAMPEMPQYITQITLEGDKSTYEWKLMKTIIMQTLIEYSLKTGKIDEQDLYTLTHKQTDEVCSEELLFLEHFAFVARVKGRCFTNEQSTVRYLEKVQNKVITCSTSLHFFNCLTKCSSPVALKEEEKEHYRFKDSNFQNFLAIQFLSKCQQNEKKPHSSSYFSYNFQKAIKPLFGEQPFLNVGDFIKKRDN